MLERFRGNSKEHDSAAFTVWCFSANGLLVSIKLSQPHRLLTNLHKQRGYKYVCYSDASLCSVMASLLGSHGLVFINNF
jgi:hypothetical protein